MKHLYNLACFSALVLAVCITAATLVGTLAQQWWIGELLSHPRPQYALILLCCLPLLVARFHQLGWLILIPLLLNLTTFSPLYFGKPLPLSTPSFTALHYDPISEFYINLKSDKKNYPIFTAIARQRCGINWALRETVGLNGGAGWVWHNSYWFLC